MRRRRFLLTIAIPFIGLVPPATQEQPQESQAQEPTSLFESTILDDLDTADLTELLDWARSLGVSTRGDRRAVEDRILQHYGLTRSDLEDAGGDAPAGGATPPPDGTSILRIEQARGSEFFTLEETDEEYLRLTGGVQLTLSEGDTVHRIEAREIVLNLSENSLTASGGVRYTTERPDGTEEFRGDTIVFQIDTWEGVFIHGITETRTGADASDVEFSVTGERITRSPEEIIVVDGGTITSSRADPPNYRIRAQRIWILAPGEWGLRNAVLYVGRVPTFYLPVFFLPGDRLFFHPAVGTRTRDGTFIQTTTYFIGQSEEQDPPISIMRLAQTPDAANREIQGLFLRIPDTPPEPDPAGWSLKLMLDAYTTLGAYAGVAATMPDLSIVERLDWRIGLGASRTVFLRNGTYTPWYVTDDGSAAQHWNSGWFFGTPTPFRYETELGSTMRLRSFSLSLDALLLSDPEFRRDFGTRSEAMDWGFLLNTDGEQTTDSASTVASTTWEAAATWSPELPSGLAPWLTTFQVPSLRARVDWRTRDSGTLSPPLTRSDVDGDPESSFFYPESLVAPDLALRIAGTLYEYPRGAGGEREGDGATDGDGESDLRPPWDQPDRQDEPDTDQYRLPEPAPDLPGIPTGDRATFRVRYSLQPSLRYDRFTDNEDWTDGADVGLRWRYSTVQTRTRGELAATAGDRDGYLNAGTTLSWEHRFQDVTGAGGLDPTEAEQLRTDAYDYRSTTLNQRSSLTAYPLRDISPLDASSLNYTLNSIVYAREFDTVAADGSPRFTRRWVGWRHDDISAHRTEARFVWHLWNADQRFTAASDLPPRDRTYEGDLSLRTGPLTSELAGGYRETDDGVWEPDTLTQTHGVSLVDGNLAATQRLEYDLDAVSLLLARSTVSVWNLDASLTGRRTGGYRFVPGSGWESFDDEAFRWTSLNVGLTIDQSVVAWKRRVNLQLNGEVSLDVDLQRYTNTSLLLDYGFTLDIYRFLNVEFTARTRNNLMYQYVGSLADEVGRPRRSFLVDLVNSLSVFDRTRREDSFFKLEALDITAIHDLEDWELRFTYTGRPELDRTVQPVTYRWRSVFSILLRWRSISELQRSIEVDDGEVSFTN